MRVCAWVHFCERTNPSHLCWSGSPHATLRRVSTSSGTADTMERSAQVAASSPIRKTSDPIGSHSSLKHQPRRILSSPEIPNSPRPKLHVSAETPEVPQSARWVENPTFSFKFIPAGSFRLKHKLNEARLDKAEVQPKRHPLSNLLFRIGFGSVGAAPKNSNRSITCKGHRQTAVMFCFYSHHEKRWERERERERTFISFSSRETKFNAETVFSFAFFFSLLKVSWNTGTLTP